jgi:hypothetical protein
VLVDGDVLTLMKLPSLVRLEVGRLSLHSDHSAAASDCIWREIILKDSRAYGVQFDTGIRSLARLPLRSSVEGGGVVKLSTISTHRGLPGEVVSAAQHLLGLPGWSFSALQASDLESPSDKFELQRLEVWIRHNDAARATAAMQLALVVRNVRHLWINMTAFERGLQPRALLEMLSVLWDVSAAAPDSSNSSRSSSLIGIAFGNIEWERYLYEETLGVEIDWDDDYCIDPLNELCDELLPVLTCALPELQWVRLGGVMPPECLAALCAAPGIARPITLALECDEDWTVASKQEHIAVARQKVAEAVAAAGVPSHVSLEWIEEDSASGSDSSSGWDSSSDTSSD